MSNKKSVAILYGGKSVEHKISINSAKNVYEFLNKDHYTPIIIGISPKGQWLEKETIDDDFNTGRPLLLILNSDQKGFAYQGSDDHLIPDIVFPVLHGTDGEDGSIQGLLKAMEIPFVGTGVLGSSLSMDKLYSKRVLSSAGLPVSPYLYYDHDNSDQIDFSAVVNELSLPFMIKAANLGSSVGVYKVNSEVDFNEALEKVFQFDNQILLESYIEGRELECSVIGNSPAVASLPAEIIVSDSYEFYTYEAKYLDPDAVELKIPASLDDETFDKVRAFSVKAYQALGCEDFARVDLFLTKENTVYVNEINTIPGFTNSSMFPMMWKERGISFTDLLSKLITMAFEKDKKLKRVSKTYNPTAN